MAESCDQEELGCLAAKLRKLAPLSDRHQRLLADLEADDEEREAGSVLVNRGDDADGLFVLKTGWIVSETKIEQGRRTIADVHFPGDIIGMSHLPFAGAAYDILALTDVVVCPMPRSSLHQAFEASPRINALLMSLAMIEHAILTDRALVGRRNDALARLALFILQTKARLSLMNDAIYDQFHCPLTQGDIGDSIGLSSVHVSRMFTRLAEMGLVKRKRDFIQVVDGPGLGALVEFANRYDDLDLGWLPED